MCFPIMEDGIRVVSVAAACLSHFLPLFCTGLSSGIEVGLNRFSSYRGWVGQQLYLHMFSFSLRFKAGA